MSAFTWIGDSFAMRVAATLLHFFWQGLLVAAVVVVAGLLLRSRVARGSLTPRPSQNRT